MESVYVLKVRMLAGGALTVLLWQHLSIIRLTTPWGLGFYCNAFHQDGI
jgi:hypothetical protein